MVVEVVGVALCRQDIVQSYTETYSSILDMRVLFCEGYRIPVEVMPNAIQIMAKAAQRAGLSLNGTVKEMLDLQKNGKLISNKVLPHFAAIMSETARNNGALDAALNSNRVAMNRFRLSLEMAADEFFKSGFSEGLTDFFNTSAKFIKENMKLWKALGKIIGGMLKALARIIDVLTPAFQALGVALDGVVFIMGDFSALLALPMAFAFIKKMGMMSAAVLGFGRASAAAGAMASGGGIGAAAMGGAGAAAAGKGMLAKAGVAGLVVAGAGTIFQTLQNAHKGDMGSNIPANIRNRLNASMTSQAQGKQEISVKLDVDGETVAQKVVNTQAMETHTDSRIHHNVGGG